MSWFRYGFVIGLEKILFQVPLRPIFISESHECLLLARSIIERFSNNFSLWPFSNVPRHVIRPLDIDNKMNKHFNWQKSASIEFYYNSFNNLMYFIWFDSSTQIEETGKQKVNIDQQRI